MGEHLGRSPLIGRLQSKALTNSLTIYFVVVFFLRTFSSSFFRVRGVAGEGGLGLGGGGMRVEGGLVSFFFASFSLLICP